MIVCFFFHHGARKQSGWNINNDKKRQSEQKWEMIETDSIFSRYFECFFIVCFLFPLNREMMNKCVYFIEGKKKKRYTVILSKNHHI